MNVMDVIKASISASGFGNNR